MQDTAPAEATRLPGPRSPKGARTRARLVGAAKEVFEQDGFLEARITDITKRAGLSHGSFYTYFESKEELFREVAQEVEEQLSAPLWDVILAPSSATPRERIREAIRRHLESYRSEAQILGVIEQVARYDPDLHAARVERHARYSAVVVESIAQLQRHGLADPELDPTLAAAVLGAMTSRFAEMWLTQGMIDCSFDAGVDHVVRLYTNALRLADPPR